MVKFVAKVSSEAATIADPVIDFVTCLNASRTYAHIHHWQTPSRSDHMALNSYYDAIPDLLDAFVEPFQGIFGKLHDFNLTYDLPNVQPIEYFQGLYEEVQTLRKQPRFPQESWLQNQVDEIAKLIASTLYQLKDLK